MNLWHTFHSLFDTNDGSLPEIDIDHLSPAGLASIWMYLRTAAAGYAGDAWFWHNGTERETPLDSVANVAQLVVTGEAEPFHTVLQGISYFGAGIPDLGVFVFQDSISLDYRMGADWSAANLTALFELLHQIQHIDPNADISLSKTFFIPEWRARFRTAFTAYVRQVEQTD
jgi:hypothetical protein